MAGVDSYTGPAVNVGDTVGILFWPDQRLMNVEVNGVNVGYQAWLPETGPYAPVIQFWSAGNHDLDFNFGQRSWTYAPPDGYLPLCSQNLPDPLVNPKKNFSANTWSGNTTATPIKTGFQPGLVWVKRRDTAYDHYLVDTVRGRTRALSSNDTGIEEAKASGIVSWDGNGFATGPDVGFSGTSMVGWTLKAGDTVTNNDGSIPSQVSANKDMGFSVVKYSGTGSPTTVGHGLGQPLSLVITKKIGDDGGNNQNWIVGSSYLGSGETLEFNGSGGVGSIGAYSDPISTSTVINYLDNNNVNKSGFDYIAYCFTNTEMIQVGTYAGNNSSNNFVSLPFKPAFLMVKSIDSTNGLPYFDWAVWDNGRSPYNQIMSMIKPNSSDPETSSRGVPMEFYSNGFSPKKDNSEMNGWQNYLYLAIAEQNFKYARGR